MNGPIKKPKKRIRLGGLEWLTIISGFVVFLGLIVEMGDDIQRAIATCSWPSRTFWGGIIVAVGVFAEVSFSIFSSRSSKREQLESEERLKEADERIKAADERIALAQQAAEEAKLAAEREQLARAKIEARMSWRNLTEEDRERLKPLLTPAMYVDIVVFDHHIPETGFFASQMIALFISARWRCREWESRAAKRRIPGPSLIIAVAVGYEEKFKELASTLASALKELDIDCGVRLGAFGCDGEHGKFTPGDFEITFQEPRVQIFPGADKLSPFRIQIGERQLTPPPTRGRAVILKRS
jgi:hypothetical protein